MPSLEIAMPYIEPALISGGPCSYFAMPVLAAPLSGDDTGNVAIAAATGHFQSALYFHLRTISEGGAPVHHRRQLHLLLQCDPRATTG